MNRIEFLKILDEELNGKMTLAEVNQNLQYYDSYIREQIQLGKSEEEVMKRLSDPRLIARTILDTTSNNTEFIYNEEDTSRYYQKEPSKNSVFSFNGKKIDISKWYMKLLIGMMILLTLSVIISIIILMVKVAIWIAVPVLVITAIIYLLQHMFGK